MKKIIFILSSLLFLYLSSHESSAQGDFNYETVEQFLSNIEITYDSQATKVRVTPPSKRRTRFGAIVFTILTGPLGGHRLYMGTEAKVPIVYTLTLGGAGIIPLIDLIHFISTKDVNKFSNKKHVFIWLANSL